MRAQVHIVSPVFVVQDLAVAGHQHRNRIRQQKHPRRDGACDSIKPLVANPDVLQFDGVHQVMQCDVRITSAQAREQRRHQSAERHQGIAAERTEEQIEPDDVRLQSVQSLDQAKRCAGSSNDQQRKTENPSIST